MLDFYPVPTKRLKTICCSSPRAFSVLLWPPLASGTPMLHRLVEETLIHTKHKIEKSKLTSIIFHKLVFRWLLSNEFNGPVYIKSVAFAFIAAFVLTLTNIPENSYNRRYKLTPRKS